MKLWVLFVVIAGNGGNRADRLTTFTDAEDCWKQAAVVRARVEDQLNYKTSTFCVPEAKP